MDPRATAIEPLIPGLRRYARAWLRDATLADDLVQDCLERAVASWSRRRGDAVRPWLYAILHNLLVDQGRRRKRRPGLVPIEAADGPSLAVAPAQEAGLLAADLLRALDALPDDQRAVLLLVSVEDLTYAEAAAVLKAPIGTVMSRLSRGRDRLATMMEAGERPRLRRTL
jgi:RNA polymerase sigma-70 factor (ECF subfamily)